MKIKGLKSMIGLLIGGAMSLSMIGGASAALITVGGVTWDPDSPADLEIKGNLREGVVDAIGDELAGFGLVTGINGTGTLQFCSGCELTFAFGGYIVTSITDDGLGGFNLVFSDGWINFYVDAGPSTFFSPFDITTAINGVLWLTLVGHEDMPDALLGTLFGNADFLTADADGSGEGFLDVAANPDSGLSGLANSFFNTDGRPDNIGGLADFFFTSSFQPGGGNPDFPLSGTGELFGDSIPEPASLAIFGFSLLGLGLVSRRRRRTA